MHQLNELNFLSKVKGAPLGHINLLLSQNFAWWPTLVFCMYATFRIPLKKRENPVKFSAN